MTKKIMFIKNEFDYDHISERRFHIVMQFFLIKMITQTTPVMEITTGDCRAVAVVVEGAGNSQV